MAAQFKADPSQSVINYQDEPAQPPPKLEFGIAGWMRQNLFSSPADIVVTIVVTLLLLALVIGFFDWSIRSANWFTIINNQRLFMMLSFEPAFEWRVAITVLLSALLTGLSLAAWARRPVVRLLAILSLAAVVVIGILPPIIEATIEQPRSFFTAGNVDIVDRASKLTPQSEVAFIAQAGETVSLSLELDEVVDIETLSRLSGFSDRATNALGNAAHNRLAQRSRTSLTFDQMLSGELTESLEERTRLNIRTFTRTNNMLASTGDYVVHIAEQLTAGAGQIGELRYWLERLERAAKALDPREQAILDQAAALDDAAKSLSINDAIPAEMHDPLRALSDSVLASEQLEDLGELLIVQLSEDLIGKTDQANEDEALITLLPREAAFLRDCGCAC